MSTTPVLGPALTEADHEFLAPHYNAIYGKNSPYEASGKLRADNRHRGALLNFSVRGWILDVEHVVAGRPHMDTYSNALQIRTIIEKIRKVAPADLRARIDFWVLPADIRFERATRKTREPQNWLENAPNEFTREETWFQYRYPKVVQPFNRHLNDEELAQAAIIRAAADEAASPPWYPIRPGSYAAAMKEWERRAR